MLALILLTNFAAADVTLKVRPQTFVAAGAALTLGTLVEGAGLKPEMRARLEETSLGEALTEDERREVSAAELMPLLRRAVEDFKADGRVHLDLPRHISVVSRAHNLEADQVTRDLLAKWQPSCGECQLSIENLSLPRVDRVRDYQLKISGELPRGSFSVPVELIRAHGAVVPAWINGRLVAKRRVPVAKRTLNAGEPVTAADLTSEFRDLSQAYDGVPEIGDLAGKHMRQALRAGDVLFSGFLEKEKAIHRGDLVQVKTGEGDWEVSINAVADRDAALGDRLTLHAAKGGASLAGQVTAPGEVQLK